MTGEVETRRAKAALEHWAIGPAESIDPVPSSTGRVARVRTAAGGDFVLKSKPDRECALREARLLRSIAHALPVAPFLPTRAGEPFAEVETSRFALYPRLPGEPLGRVGAATARALGAAIASLHAALAVCSPDGFSGQTLAVQIRDRALPTLLRHRDQLRTDALVPIAEDVASEAGRLEPALRAHLIHRDAHAGNFLFEAGELSGILDFDHVMHGVRIFDVCYCASGMLAAGFRERERRDAWPSLLRAVIDGYSSRASLAATELEAVPAVLAAIQLIFVAWGIESRLHDVVVLSQEVLLWQWSHCPGIARLHVG